MTVLTVAPSLFPFSSVEQPTFSKGLSLGRLSQIIKKAESFEEAGGKAYAVQKATEDTLTSLGSRMLVMSSVAEGAEILFNELLETAVVYGLISPVGDFFNKHYTRLAQRRQPVHQKAYLEPLEDLIKKKANQTSTIDAKTLSKQVKKVSAVRLASFASMLAVACLFAQSSIVYAKNIVTAYSFKKDSYSGMLSYKGDTIADPAKSEVVQKSVRRIGQLAAATTGVIGASALMARFGGGLMVSKFGRGFQKGVEKLGKFFDFSIQRNADTGKILLNKAGRAQLDMTLPHLGGFMAIAFGAYMDAARDKLERQETAPRLLIIFANLLFFKQFFDKKILHPFIKKHMPDLIQADKRAKNFGKVLSYKQLKEKIAHLPRKQQKRFLRFKQLNFLAPYVFGTIIVSCTNSVLNRLFTKRRFQQNYVKPVLKKMASLDKKPLRPLHTSVSRSNPFAFKAGLNSQSA